MNYMISSSKFQGILLNNLQNIGADFRQTTTKIISDFRKLELSGKAPVGSRAPDRSRKAGKMKDYLLKPEGADGDYKTGRMDNAGAKLADTRASAIFYQLQ